MPLIGIFPCDLKATGYALHILSEQEATLIAKGLQLDPLLQSF